MLPSHFFKLWPVCDLLLWNAAAIRGNLLLIHTSLFVPQSICWWIDCTFVNRRHTNATPNYLLLLNSRIKRTIRDQQRESQNWFNFSQILSTKTIELSICMIIVIITNSLCHHKIGTLFVIIKQIVLCNHTKNYRTFKICKVLSLQFSSASDFIVPRF